MPDSPNQEGKHPKNEDSPEKTASKREGKSDVTY
jgi:hypothetical protein